MGGAKLDLSITDPPYNVDYGEKTKFLEAYTGHAGSRRNSDIRNDKMSGQAFHEFLLSAFRNMNEAMRPGAAAYVFHAESTGSIFRQAYAEVDDTRAFEIADSFGQPPPQKPLILLTF